MKNRLYDGGTILVVIGILFAAYLTAGGLRTSAERCEFHRAAYADWIAKGKPGGEDEKVESAHRWHKWLCGLRGIEI